LRHRDYGYRYAVFGARTEFHFAVRKRKERVVLGDADIGAGMHLGAALANENIAGKNLLAAVTLHAEPLARRVASVARGTACFLMCHRLAPNFSSSLYTRLG